MALPWAGLCQAVGLENSHPTMGLPPANPPRTYLLSPPLYLGHHPASQVPAGGPRPEVTLASHRRCTRL